MVRIIFIVGAGSLLGGVLRFTVTRFLHQNLLTSFPYGTLLVNITGCFLIGIFYGLSERGSLMNNEWRMFLTVGFCGGFTTFSAFAHENMTLLRDGNFVYAAFYTSLSVFAGLMATYLGNLLVKNI